MRFNEIISERGRNQGSVDGGGGDDSPAPGSVAAAQADAARIAQGDKNLNAVKGFFGMKPTELKDAPPGTSIDPIQRSRMGYKPATQKEIADFQAANPNYGKVVGGDGKPIKTGDGSDLVSGGGAAVVQTAQAAAPQSKGDAKAGQGGYDYQPPTDTGDQGARLKGRYPAPAAAAPAAAAPAAAADDSAAPAAAAPAAAADDSAARAAAAAAAGQTPIRDTGDNTQLKSEKERLQALAGIERVPGAAQAGQGGYDYQPPAAEPVVTAAEPVVTAAELGSQEFPMTPGPEVPATTAALPVRPGQQTSGQAATPPGKKAAPRISPAIVGYASSMGLYKNGQPDPVAIKAFQEKNGLEADGIIGPNTSGAILSAAKPGMAGSGRGQQGGAPAPAYPGTPTVTPTAPAQRGANTKATTPVTPGRTPAPALTNRTLPKSQQMSNQKTAIKESSEIQRMRFLAGLSKD